MQASQDPKPQPVLRLRVPEFREHAGRLGIKTNYGIAKHLGVTESTVARIVSGEIVPGERFIARALTAFPDCDFSDLFEVQVQAA